MNTLSVDLVARLFVKILQRNTQNNDIDNVEAMVYLNEATREVYRWFEMYLPDRVQKIHTYTASGGETTYELPLPTASIRTLTINGKPAVRQGAMVPPYNDCLIRYTLVGFDTIQLFGKELKDKDKVVVVFLPAACDELIYGGTPATGQRLDSLFPQMLDDILIEHAMVAYEAARGMMQDTEMAMRAKWFQQIQTLMMDDAQPTSIGEYYQGHAPRGDML